MSPAKAPVLLASEADYGSSSPESLARFDHGTSSWRTSQLCLVEGTARFSETWPRSGMTRSGIAYRLPPLARLTAEIGSGSLLPTPTAGDSKSSGSRNTTSSKAHPGVSLTDWARGDGGKGRRLIPTPRASEWKGTGPLGSKSHLHRLSHGYLDATMQELCGASGRLNPRFVEWVMGFTPGYTDVDGDDDEMGGAETSAARAAGCNGDVLRGVRSHGKTPATPPGLLGSKQVRASLPSLPCESGSARRIQEIAQDASLQSVRDGVRAESQQEAHDLQPRVPECDRTNQRDEALARRIRRNDKPRLRALGNAVVPQVVQVIGEAIMRAAR